MSQGRMDLQPCVGMAVTQWSGCACVFGAAICGDPRRRICRAKRPPERHGFAEGGYQEGSSSLWERLRTAVARLERTRVTTTAVMASTSVRAVMIKRLRRRVV